MNFLVNTLYVANPEITEVGVPQQLEPVYEFRALSYFQEKIQKSNSISKQAQFFMGVLHF